MDLTVIVPTQNEEGNISTLVSRTDDALSPLGLEWEMIFVDDSDDATPSRVHEAAGRGHPVRLLHRAPTERVGGLGGAVDAGFRIALASHLVAVMDGDLQHRPEMLVPLVEAVRNGRADVAIASRRWALASPAGGVARLWRCWVSRASRSLTQLLLPRLADVRDPLAGFFAMRRSVIEGVQLRPEGFKILLEVLVRGSWSTVVEIPCELDPRLHGQSKARLDEGVAFGRHLIRLRLAERRTRRAGTATRRRAPVAAVASVVAVEGTSHRELLGDEDDGPAPCEDAVGTEGEDVARTDVEVPCQPFRLLAAGGQDLPEGLEPVLAEQLADGDGRGEQPIDQGGTQAIHAQHGFGVQEVPTAVAPTQEHVASQHRLIRRNPELGDVGARGA